MKNRFDDIIDTLNVFDDWEDSYDYIIMRGKALKTNPNIIDKKNLISGCQSSVWIDAEYINNKVHYYAFSDSTFIKGLIALIFDVINDETKENIADVNFEQLAEIDFFKFALSSGRQNGLSNILKRLRDLAQ